MNQQPANPEPNTHARPRNVNQFNSQRHQNPASHPRQQTLWGFISNHLIPQRQPRETTHPEPPITHDNTQPTRHPGATPPSTPIPVTTQNNSQPMPPITREPQQRPLRTDRSNEPWGDCWALCQPTSLFRVVSKNTRTINLQNMDMKAITKELMLCSVSVFAAQETNVHWNEDTTHLLQTQCQSVAPQIQIATSTSAEKTTEWYKPGGTITMAMNNWTSRVVTKGHDTYLGR